MNEQQLREDFKKAFEPSQIWEDADNNPNSIIHRLEDFWLQKMTDQKERLIKEVTDMKKPDTLAGRVYNHVLEDILRRLQSV